MSTGTKTYKEVVSWVESNFLDLRVYGKCDGVDIGQGITVNWECKTDHASYLSYEDSEGKVYHKIVVWDFEDDRYGILALLHELGHHTECQDGDAIYQEKRAWEGCFKWMKHLNIDVTKDLLYKASEWFSSYLNFYCKNEDDWLSARGMQHISGCDVISSTDWKIASFQVTQNLPPKTSTLFQNVPNFEDVTGKVKGYVIPSVFGKESWRKAWK